MATAKSPGRKTRQPNYHNYGEEGRVTGVKVAPRPRDEHGLEEMDGLFSPTPGKPSAARSSKRTKLSNGTSRSSASMVIAESSAPEPTTVLTNRVRESTSKLSVPHSRSPIKSHILGPPRRGSSVGAMSPARPSSSARNKSHSPAFQNSTKRKLDFSPHKGRQDPYSASRGSHGRIPLTNGSPARPQQRDIYSMPRSSPEKEQNPLPAGLMDDDDDDNVGLPEDYDDNAGPEDSQLVDAEVNAEVDATNPVDEEVVPSSGKKAAKGRGRPKTRSSDASQTAEGQQEAEADAEVEEAPFKKSRGRPAKAGKPAALAAKDKNQPPKAAKKTKAAKDEDKKDATQGGPRQRIRHQTPADAVEMGHTRAGRHVYKPLDYWKGERAEFRVGDTHDEFELAELILVDDATPIKRPHRRVGKTKASKKRKYNVYEEDIEDNELEPWETSDGVIRAPVQLWDAEQGVNTADEEEQVVGFSSTRIQPLAAPDNPNFRFVKLLSTAFFGSGMIELPPNGSKGTKNSRTFHFSFFVVSGKVAVEVNGSRFVISKGGMWQVPRGNFYSISNENDTHEAKIFFSQSREVAATAPEPFSIKELRQ